MKGRSVIAYNRERTRDATNLCGKDQRAEEQSVQDPIQRGNVQLVLRPPQVKQRDEDRGGTRLASSNDSRDELLEATILAVHLI